MAAQVSAAQVAAGLAQRIDELALLILTEVRREGSELRGRGADGGTWSVVLRGRKQGVFCNWNDDRMKGDSL